MYKFSILCVALCCVSLTATASAQDSTAAFDATTSASEPAAPASLIPADREPWQLGVGFQYTHFNVLQQHFNDYGYHAGITRYLSNWFGVEGAADAGFGHITSGEEAKSLFLGGGAHVSLFNGNHIEPWVHVLGGWERLRFTQSATLGSQSHAAFMAGGGLDYKIGSGRLYWRVQGDYLGSNFGPSLSSNYAVGTGLVLNF